MPYPIHFPSQDCIKTAAMPAPKKVLWSEGGNMRNEMDVRMGGCADSNGWCLMSQIILVKRQSASL